jgi:SAM-dependent methyltransferase
MPPTMTPPTPFYGRPGLHVECYDAMHEAYLRTTSVAGDGAWYARLARRTGGPVLEGGCGTGRVAWGIARAGVEVVGFDRSLPMLVRAEGKRASLPPRARSLARFVRADFRTFDLGRRFPLAIIPFRAFQSLLTPEDQRRALRRFREHLRPGGLLVLDLFDPRLEFCVPGGRSPRDRSTIRHPDRGTRVTVEISGRVNDPVRQVLSETWTFREGRRPPERETLTMRWTYRHELRLLCEAEGFTVESEFSDFRGHGPAYGNEIILVLRRS